LAALEGEAEKLAATGVGGRNNTVAYTRLTATGVPFGSRANVVSNRRSLSSH
jgi:hypothetical protein